MKTITEIADGILNEAQNLARKQRTTLSALAEEGLRLVLAREERRASNRLAPLVTFGEGGLRDEFRDWDWNRLRDEALSKIPATNAGKI